MGTSLRLPDFNLSPAEQLTKSITTIKNVDRSIENILHQKIYDWDSLVAPLLVADNEIVEASAIISFYYYLNSGTESSAALETLTSYLADRTARIIEDGRIYHALRKIDKKSLSEEQKKVVEHQLTYFNRAGSRRTEAKKQAIEEINRELLKQTISFQINYKIAENNWQMHITDEAMLDGVDETTMEMLRANARKRNLPGWVITYSENTINELLRDCTNRSIRKKLFFHVQTMASDYCLQEQNNFDLISNILGLRHQKARLLGHKSFTEQALEGMTVTDPDEIIRTLEHMMRKVRRKMKQEYKEYSQLAKKEIGRLERWDIDHYADRYHCETAPKESFSEYLETVPTFRRILQYFGTLLDIQFVEIETDNKPHRDVLVFEAQQNGKVLGGFYADMLKRTNKYDGAWVNNYSFRVGDDPQVLMYSVNYDDTMSHSDLVVMLHEFGHLLHGLYNQCPYATYGGSLSLSWDAIEFPSQFFENFAWHPASIRVIARHKTTDKPPSKKMIEQRAASCNHASGFYMHKFIKKALADLALHHRYKKKLNFVEQQIAEIFETKGIPFHLWETRLLSYMHHSFGSDSGYESMYYVYFWSELLSKDAFEPFLSLTTEKQIQKELKRFMDVFILPVDEDVTDLFKTYLNRPFNDAAWCKFYGFS